MKKLPELLAPAGSPRCLEAAISAGADAIYMGMSRYNARANAENFGQEELIHAVKLCRMYSKKLYITLNTLVFDKELSEVLNQAHFCAEAGVDAFIVQDLGLMKLLRETLPDIQIHSSTQCATHNVEQIKALHSLGVSRSVIARECSREDIKKIKEASPVEIEVFVHGALCMSHSGACLMSAYLGGRSGNRGECAQPCRLSWSLQNSKNPYPLSLKDLSLAGRVKELCEIGVDSFKIEGRMKSAEYVYNTVSVWRKLLDEVRDADFEEKKFLENTFSRSGFTEGYYIGDLGSNMFGVRAVSDKGKTRETEKKTDFELPKIPIKIKFDQEELGARLTLSTKDKSVVCSCEALPAQGDGTTSEDIKSSLSKMGDTLFSAQSVEINMSSPVFFRRSVLNALRREGVGLLQNALAREKENIHLAKMPVLKDTPHPYQGLWVVYSMGRKVGEGEIKKLLNKGASGVFVPLFGAVERISSKCGVVLPRAVFEKDKKAFIDALVRARELGYTDAFAENLGVGLIAKEYGFELYGGAGLNAVNSYSLNVLEDFGFKACFLSGEVNEAQKKALKSTIALGDTVWGRAPLMLVENCPLGVRDNCFDTDCVVCRKKGQLVDRTGESFPIIPDAFHRGVIYNSRPTYRADTTPSEKISVRVIYITDEADSEKVLDMVLQGKEPKFKFTRK